MSLILEALRKSEAERRRDSAPDLALELPPAPTRPAPAAPAWLWPVLAVAVALAALGGWLGSRPGRHAIAAPTPSPAAPIMPASADVPRIVPRPNDARPPAGVATPAPVAATPLPADPATTPQSTATADRAAPSHPAPQSAPALPLPAAAATGTPDIAATTLPPVKLSMHMWDADPARRFVILDGQRMAEGDRSGGLSVVAIDRKGVTIERDGQRAHVPLP
jgi:general secretion pathway protein B